MGGERRDRLRHTTKGRVNPVGYRPEPRRFRITFDETHKRHGLEIVTRSVPVHVLMNVLKAAGAGMGNRRPSLEDVEAIGDLFDNFGGALIEWNLEHPDTGDPVDPSPAGLRTLDFDLVTELAMEWVGAVMGGAAPLGGSSRPGGSEPSHYPVASLPMIPLSEPIASGSLRI